MGHRSLCAAATHAPNRARLPRALGQRAPQKKDSRFTASAVLEDPPHRGVRTLPIGGGAQPSSGADRSYGAQLQLFTVMLVPQYTTHAAELGVLYPVG